MDPKPTCRLLVIADVHAVPRGTDESNECVEKGYSCWLGKELLRRAIEDAKLRGGFDVIAFMGDMVIYGDAPWAGDCYRELLAEVRASAPQTPLLVVPGNHDGDPRGLLETFEARPGLHEMMGYRFICFVDPYTEDDFCTRRESDRAFLDEVASQPGGPIIVLQHNPMKPIAHTEYPYLLTNRSKVMTDYSKAGVLLSISGHFHPGQGLHTVGGVQYFTAAALQDPNYSYAMVTLRGRQVTAEIRLLTLKDDLHLPVVDCHSHTEFAYCARDISAAQAVHRTETLGLAGICLVEHAPQLYVQANDYWSAKHLLRPTLWRSAQHSRMEQFKEMMLPLRSEKIRIGLEVELDIDGELTIHDEDRDWIDLTIGAIHWLYKGIDDFNDAELAREFMRINEKILARGVDVLAHPFRLFDRSERKNPVELYGALADAVAETHTAAELNFHDGIPDADFFAACIERGVKIALGSDAHRLRETAAITPHLAFLRKIVGPDRLSDVLYNVPPGRQGEMDDHPSR